MSPSLTGSGKDHARDRHRGWEVAGELPLTLVGLRV